MAVLAIVLAVVAVAAVAALVVSRRALADAARRHEALAHELDAAREEAAAAAATLAVAREGLTAADALIRSLWSLELLRVAREWMVTGGALPDTVAADVAAELTTALRMDLERHREETGIPGDLDASRALDGDVPTATALTAFRLTQEVIAVTARASDGFTVRASLDDGALAVAVALDAADADVPAVVHAIAAGAGATVTVDGPTVTLRFPL